MTEIAFIRFVSENEYKKLQDENTELKLKISELYRKEESYKDTIRTNELTIQQLKEENQMLRQKISDLENTIVKLETKINQFEEKEQYNKFMIAIQDINRLEQIETKLSGNDKKNLIRLRKSRVSECHYIEEDDDEDDKNDRRTVLYERIQNMSPQVRRRFNNMFPGLLDVLMTYIVQIKTQPSEDSLKDILDWWE